MCPAFFEKNLGIDPQEKTLDVEDYFIGRVSHAFSPFNRRPQGARHEEIVVRHAEAEDAQALQQIHMMSEVIYNTLQIPHPSLAMWRERLGAPQPGRRQLVACMDGEVVGHLALTVEQNPRRSHVATFGMSVHPGCRNRGVASALMREMVNLCDNWLRIERIELTVFVDNAPALAVYRKFGFETEGTGKRYGLRNGEYVDAYFMARMKAG